MCGCLVDSAIRIYAVALGSKCEIRPTLKRQHPPPMTAVTSDKTEEVKGTH